MTTIKITVDMIDTLGRGFGLDAIGRVRQLLENAGLTVELHPLEVEQVVACYRRADVALRDAQRRLAAGPLPEGAQIIESHEWREYNEWGNSCHYPGCPLTESEHRP